MKMIKNRIAPRTLPCCARDKPIPAAMILSVPQKKNRRFGYST
ncbi:MAG: hypothetical protein ACLTJE_28915 [Enterocloster bolteae]